MTRARRLMPFAVAAALTLPLAGCGDDPQPSAAPSTVTVTQTPEPTEADAPEQQQLTKRQLTAALPTEDEAPSGFRVDPEGFDTERVSERTTDPEACLALYMTTPEQAAFDKDHRVESGAARFSQKPGEPGTAGISIAVWTHDEPYPKEFFDEAGAALSECTTFSTKANPDEAPGDWQADAIPTPTVGDQSFGVRIGRPDVDYLWVRSGNNLIHARMLTGYRQANDQRLQKYTQGVLDDLKG